MFRLYRKTIYRRWHANHKISLEKKPRHCRNLKAAILCSINPEQQNHSNDSHWKKQHADKQEKKYWDDPHFHFNFLKTSIFETAGWLGTVAVCFNYHFKYINSVLEYEKINSSCLFSNIVLALPRRYFGNVKTYSTVSDSESPKATIYSSEKDKILDDADILERNIKALTEQYAVATENLIGVKNINKNDKKAFHSFQNAARHGYSAGFYNLGLCYELGKGTKVNLNMAAYCYRKAAMKGHGLASFNLAVFFYRGMGGIPVDAKIAKELLAEAAEKDVPEAQLYFGILFLEEKRWLDAVKIFSSLAEKNLSDAQYYLGLCYEKGLGVKRNEKVASELFKKSAKQGNRRAGHKLQNNKRSCYNIQHSFLNTNEIKVAESSSLHLSLSVPELSAVVKQSNQGILKLPVLSYLDLFTPFLIVNKASKLKSNFYSDEKNLAKEYSSTLLSFKTIPTVVMEVKTQL